MPINHQDKEKHVNYRWTSLLAATLMLAFAGLRAPLYGAASPSPAAAPTTCKQLTYHVTLTPRARTHYKVVGWLCGKALLGGRTIQVLLHGDSVNHMYWDFPIRPQQYSYVRALTNAGYATLNLDLPGAGVSDIPPGDQVSFDAKAYVVHQIVQTLRSGHGPYSSFGKVLLVGHSTGAFFAPIEANRYADVDGLILTGFLHTLAPTANLVGNLWWSPANDPHFAHRHIPPGYLTVIPGTAATIAFNMPDTDADVLAYASAHTDLAPTAENGAEVLDPALVQGIHVPILTVVGQYDAFFCTPPSCPEGRAEPAFYDCRSQSTGVHGITATDCAPRSELEVVVIPNAGHALNLQRNAPQWFAIARHWSDRQFGPCPKGCQATS
jgi:pimeloyl-ACP methyl ester carboxylesterase